MPPRDMDAILSDPIIELVIRNQLQRCEYKTVLHTVEIDQVCFHDAMIMYLLNEERHGAL